MIKLIPPLNPLVTWLAILILFMRVGNAWGAEFFEYGQSIRALGMGNAYTAVVDDGDSLFYNPAGLGRNQEINLRIINLNLGLNGQDAYNAAQEITKSTATGIDRFSGIFGQQLWIGTSGKVTLTTPRFGVGIYDSGFAGIELKNPILPYFNVNYINDYGLVVGGAAAIGPQSFFGMNFKRINRSGASEEFGVSSFLDGKTDSIQSNLNKKGVGYGADLGFVWQITAPLNPVISGVWKDIGTTTFLKEPNIEKPPRITDEQILGVATSFDTLLFGMTAAIDIKHINATTETISKKVHMGLEFDLPFIDIRGGFSQGYYSLGVSLDLFILQMDLAYYGVELGEYAGQDQDRRIQLAITMDLGFDPHFNLLDKNKLKGRKLKRRR